MHDSPLFKTNELQTLMYNDTLGIATSELSFYALNFFSTGILKILWYLPSDLFELYINHTFKYNLTKTTKLHRFTISNFDFNSLDGFEITLRAITHDNSYYIVVRICKPQPSGELNGS